MSHGELERALVMFAAGRQVNMDRPIRNLPVAG